MGKKGTANSGKAQTKAAQEDAVGGGELVLLGNFKLSSTAVFIHYGLLWCSLKPLWVGH